MIKTTYKNERELIQAIMDLYGVDRFNLDPCYSVGRVWTGLNQPIYKFDINPSSVYVNQGDCRNLPFQDESLNSIFFDPPFLVRSGKSKTGLMANRFSAFSSVKEMSEFLSASLLEFSRILKDSGVLVVKCQDTVNSHVQVWTHVEIMRRAEEVGLFCNDLIILINENVIHNKANNQVHARKTHSYFLVFIKNRKRLD